MKRVIKDFGFLVLISQKPFLSSSRSPLTKSSRGGDSPLAATAVAARPCYHCIPAAMADCCNLHSIRWLMAAAPGLALQHFMSHVKAFFVDRASSHAPVLDSDVFPRNGRRKRECPLHRVCYVIQFLVAEQQRATDAFACPVIATSRMSPHMNPLAITN